MPAPYRTRLAPGPCAREPCGSGTMRLVASQAQGRLSVALPVVRPSREAGGSHVGSAVALPWALHISPPPTRPRRSPLRGSPACQTPPSTPGQPALTPERDSLGVVRVGWFGRTRSRKANPGGRVPRRQGPTVGQGGRVLTPQPWLRRHTGKAGAEGPGLMFRGRMGAGRQVWGFGSMAAQGTAPPYARAWLHRQVKHEAPQPRGVGKDHSSAGGDSRRRGDGGQQPWLV